MKFWKGISQDRLLIDLSLWSANLANLGEEVQRTEALVDGYHFDVSDAHFVPGLLFFPDLIAALRPLTARPFHVHLMVERPDTLVQPFVEAGADLITVHVENGPACAAAIELIRKAGKSAGIALSVETAPHTAIPYLDAIEAITLMGTPLGIKGQGLAPEAAARIQATRQILRAHGDRSPVILLADGGIRQHTAALLRQAGADGIVPGSLYFGSPNPAETIHWLHSLPR